MGRSRAWFAAVMMVAACKGKAKQEPAKAEPEPEPAAAKAPDAAADPCASSAASLAAIEALRAEGRIGRAHRDAVALDAACPSDDAKAAIAAIAKELDAGGLDAEALFARARDERLAGQAADARRDLDRAAMLVLPEGAPELVIAPKIGAIRAVAHSADGKHVIAVGKDGEVTTWDVATGTPVSAFELPPLGEGITASAGAVLAADHGLGLYLVDPATGALTGSPGLRVIETALAVALSPDGKWAAVSLGGGTALIALATGATQIVVQGDAMLALAFSPDSTLLAGSTDEDRNVTLFDVATLKPLRKLIGHTELVRGLAWSPDGARLASGGYDHTIRIWDPATGAAGQQLDAGDDVFALAFAPDGSALVAGVRGALEMFPTGQAKPTILGGTTDSATSLSWSPDGSTLAAGQDDGTVSIYDAHGALVRAVSRAVSPPRAIAFRDHELVSVGRDGGVFVWGDPGPAVSSLGGPVDAAAISPDAKMVACSHGNHVVELRGIDGSAVGPVLAEAPNLVNDLRFSPDGRWLLGNTRGTALWNLTDGTLQVIDDGRDPTFSRDGLRVAVATNDGVVVRTLGASGDPLTAPLEYALAVAFAPDGAFTAINQEGVVVTWDANGKELRRVALGASGAGSVAYAPDGTQLAVVNDGKLHVYDASGKELASGETTSHVHGDLAWRADGKLLAFAGFDGAIDLFTPDAKRVATLATSLGGDWFVAAGERVDGPRAPWFLLAKVGNDTYSSDAFWDRLQVDGLFAAVRP